MTHVQRNILITKDPCSIVIDHKDTIHASDSHLHAVLQESRSRHVVESDKVTA
jgi:hypothetical protein